MGQTPSKVTGIVIVWAETLLYGMYASLFIETLFISLRRRRVKSRQSKIFLWTSIAMFLMATAHLAINFYRLLRGYAYLADAAGPVAYFFELESWDNIAHGAIEVAMTWTGNFLVMYRCYLIWDCKIKVILLPLVMQIMGMISYGIAVYLSRHIPSGTVFSHSLVQWVTTLDAILTTQDALCTAFIAYRIYTQHNRVCSAYSGSGQAKRSAWLISTVRIVVESAAISSFQGLILIILYALKNNAQYVIEATLVPTIGIVYTLITVRIAMMRSKALLPTTRGVVPETTELRFTSRAASEPGTIGRNLSVVESGLGGNSEVDLPSVIEIKKVSQSGALRSTNLSQRSGDSSINLREEGQDAHRVFYSPLANMMDYEHQE